MEGLTQGKEKRCGGSAWESNPPNELLTRYTGFEVRESHQCPIHFPECDKKRTDYTNKC